jgi:uncharacterized protein (DUF1697 family)
VGDDRYFAFLRAINTGTRRLTNERLLAPFHDLGFTDVAAYQAAGNVTFRGGAVDERHIEAALADAYGFETPTFVRAAAEVAGIVHAAPFAPDDLARTAGKVQVTFLRSAASPEQVERVVALVPEGDRVVVSDREWYWLPVDGVSTSMLPVGQIESVLGEMTMRTLGTVMRLHAKFAD